MVEVSHYYLFLESFKSTKTSTMDGRHQKKCYNLMIEERQRDGIQQNPNKIIANITNIDLSNDEISMLELGLQHGVLVRPKEQEMIAVVEYICEKYKIVVY